MKLTRIGVVLVAALASMALAQSLAMRLAEGRGFAENQQGQRAEFDFRVVKVGQGEQFRLDGHFRGAFLAPDHPGVRIHMPRARLLEVDQNLAHFGGPGVLLVRTATGVEEVRGQVRVAVADNRPPNGTLGHPDRLRVRFEPIAGTQEFLFEGVVRRGDIVVRTRR
jgi:hypothetical protein